MRTIKAIIEILFNNSESDADNEYIRQEQLWLLYEGSGNSGSTLLSNRGSGK